ncbi:hypothetical protein NLU13_8819 [Sarocladium strictum]|uniref:DUF7708 domain-containing protein n=1 Tax=Sarocladium strictum TaxID=5046 RepID=A0AA39GA44_SARSR|nr:hypothetical protein NLU13_8819 [Sarocladium strictum]
MKRSIAERKGAEKVVVMYGLEAPARLPEGSSVQALAGVVHHDAVGRAPNVLSPWRKFFEPSPVHEPGAITTIIAREAENLRKKWVTLYNSGPKEDQVDLATFDPTFEGVVDLINSVTESLQTKRREGAAGKVTSGFHSFCDKLDSHSAFLKMLPDGNEYVSIFTGSLNAVIQASVNHGRVAEELAEALCEISQDVSEVRIDLELFRTKDLIESTADLYAHIFIFLSSYMDHLMRKRRTRLLDAFNENRSLKITAEIKRIKDKVARIRYMLTSVSGKKVMRDDGPK